MAETTFARGSRRIDFILVNEAIVPAIVSIGTLGICEAVISDHIMMYIDLVERKLLKE